MANVLEIVLQGDARGLNRSLQSASSRLNDFGKRVSSFGSSLQTRLALPLLAVGGASIKMAADVDESLTKIKSLVGIASDEVDAMGVSAQKMAENTSKSSAEAAEALFYITSAGLRGSEAMEVLDASLKAAASGLGDTKVVADLATSAMNAYGSSVLSATDATDVMVATVREGKLAPEELSASMGRVLPIASAMNVRFNEVGAAFAALSRTGTGAAEAATQIRGIFSSLLKPTKQAEEALISMGTSSSELRQSLSEDGLLATLNTLKELFHGNEEAASMVFGNIRALSGVLDLVGKNSETTTDIFERMQDTLGETDKAFKTLSDSASFKLKKSLNQAKETFRLLGSQLLVMVVPAVEKAANFVRNLYSAFNKLSPATKKIIVALSGIAIVLPTIITLVGTLISVFSALLSPVGLVIAALAGIAFVVYKNWGSILKVFAAVRNWIVELYNESLAFRIIINSIGLMFKNVWTFVKFFFKSLWDTVRVVGNSIKEIWLGIGDVIKGVFNRNWDDIKSGGKRILDNYTNTFSRFFETLNKNGKEAGKELGENFNESLVEAMTGSLKEKTAEELQDGLDDVGDSVMGKIKGIWNNITGMFENKTSSGSVNFIDTEKEKEKVNTLTQAYKDGADQIAASIGVYNARMADMSDTATTSLSERMTAILEGVNMVSTGIQEAFLGAFEAVLEGGGNFFESLIKGLGKLIKKLIAAALAAAVLSALLGGLGIGKIGKTVTTFSSLFASFTGIGGSDTTAFASGGIVSGPVNALVGEYPGARSNPEVIAPLDKLKGMINPQSGNGNVNVTGEFVVRGQDLVVALDRAQKTQNRLT